MLSTGLVKSIKQQTVCGSLSSQAKDTKVVPLAARLFKIEGPAAPFHWIQSKPIASNQTIHNKKSGTKQKTMMATSVKNESCRVCDQILPKKRRRSIFNVFSSPEHNVLRMSYWDRSLSVRPSVNNYLKNLLLWNRTTDFNEASQKWSLGDALSEYFKDMNSMKNSGCHGNRKKKLLKSSCP